VDQLVVVFSPVITPTCAALPPPPARQAAAADDLPITQKYANMAFNLNAYFNQTSLLGQPLANPLVITVTYDDRLLVGLVENTLHAYRCLNSAWTREGLTFIARDTDLNTYTFSVMSVIGEIAFFANTPALFTPIVRRDSPSYRLTVASVGNGSGVVATSPGIIFCGSTCTEIYVAQTLVTLYSAANSGSTFTAWDGACNGVGICIVPMDSDKQVQAIFTQDATAVISATGRMIITMPVTFTATLGMSSFDTCTWDFNDGNTAPCQPVTAAGATAPQDLRVRTSHIYAVEGTYVVSVTASNRAGVITAALPIQIANPTNLEPIEEPTPPARP